MVADYMFVENEELENKLVQIIQSAYDAAENEDTFFVGLSGGSLPKLLVTCFRKLENINWKKWLFFFCDERLVPSASEDSTFGTYKRLLDPMDPKLPLSLSQFVTIDFSLRGESSANDYLSKLRQHFSGQMPSFNILFLGIGPDGHTCSLFPNHNLLKVNSQQKLVAFIGDSPKPPPERVTFTFPVLNNAKLCLFVVTGSGKAEIVKRIVKDKEILPASMVDPTNGRLVWLIDEKAASCL